MKGALLLLAVALSACTVGPDYRRPDVVAPSTWRTPADRGEVANAAWWDQFQDPVLSSLVRRALANNKDIAIATANVDQAFARYGIARSALFPQVDAGAGAARIGASESGPAPVVPGHATFNDYTAGFTASFELDVWGRLRRANESARASVLSSEEARNTVVLTLVAAVASGYIQLRATDRQLEIARSTSASLGEAARLQRLRFQEGAVPESDFRQAESQYQAASAQVPELERQVARLENFIRVLLGGNPGPVERGRGIEALAFPVPPEGMPADLIGRRPDIRAAEQDLIAANADIGVARAAYFPRISLTALFGVESGELSDLFKGPSRTWSYGAGLSLPIFNAGRVRSQVAQAEAAQRAALAAYQKSIIAGFQEVEDVLVDRAKLAQVRDTQAKNVASLQRFRDLAALRYREGATIYLEVANAEQLLFTAQLAYVATQSQLFQAYAGLYKAMGGGWVAEAERLLSTASNSDGRP